MARGVGFLRNPTGATWHAASGLSETRQVRHGARRRVSPKPDRCDMARGVGSLRNPTGATWHAASGFSETRQVRHGTRRRVSPKPDRCDMARGVGSLRNPTGATWHGAGVSPKPDRCDMARGGGFSETRQVGRRGFAPSAMAGRPGSAAAAEAGRPASARRHEPPSASWKDTRPGGAQRWAAEPRPASPSGSRRTAQSGDACQLPVGRPAKRNTPLGNLLSGIPGTGFPSVWNHGEGSLRVALRHEIRESPGGNVLGPNSRLVVRPACIVYSARWSRVPGRLI